MLIEPATGCFKLPRRPAVDEYNIRAWILIMHVAIRKRRAEWTLGENSPEHQRALV